MQKAEKYIYAEEKFTIEIKMILIKVNFKMNTCKFV